MVWGQGHGSSVNVNHRDASRHRRMVAVRAWVGSVKFTCAWCHLPRVADLPPKCPSTTSGAQQMMRLAAIMGRRSGWERSAPSQPRQTCSEALRHGMPTLATLAVARLRPPLSIKP